MIVNIRSLISMIVCVSIVTSSPGVAALIDDVSGALGIRPSYKVSPDERKTSPVRILTGEGEYFMGDPRPLLGATPITITELSDRKLEIRRFDRYEDPNFLSGYVATHLLETHLWGGSLESSDIWFLMLADGSVYGLEVRSLPCDAVTLEDAAAVLGMGAKPFNAASVSRAIINSLLFKPQDATSQNFRVSSQGMERFLLSGRAFEDVNPQSIGCLDYGSLSGEHKVLTRNVLYTREDFLSQRLDARVRDQLLDIQPEVLLSQWLAALVQEDERIRSIEKVAFSKVAEAMEDDKVPDEETMTRMAGWREAFHNQLSDGGFPIHLKKSTVNRLVKMLYQLQDFLGRKERITHGDVLQEIDFMTSLFYEQLGIKALEGGVIEETIGELTPFPGLPATVNSLLPHYEQGVTIRRLFTTSQTFDHFLESFFWKSLEGGRPDPSLLNAVALGFKNKEPGVRTLKDSARDHFYRLLSHPETSADAFGFAQKLGFDLYWQLDEQTLLDKALANEDFARACVILGLSDEEILVRGVNTTALDTATSLRNSPYAKELFRELFIGLVEEGHGKKLKNPEAVVEWYREEKPYHVPDSDFLSALRTLALRNQKFSWLVVLEDVFPKLRRAEEDLRGELANILKRPEYRPIFTDPGFPHYASFAPVPGITQEILDQMTRDLAPEVYAEIRRTIDVNARIDEWLQNVENLKAAAIHFIEAQTRSGTLNPAIYFHLTDEETTQEKMVRLEAYLRSHPVRMEWGTYEDEVEPTKRLKILLDFSRKIIPHILTVDDALTGLNVPPRADVAVRPAEEKLETYLRSVGWSSLGTFLKTKLSSLEEVYYEVKRVFDPNADMLIKGAEEGFRLLKPFVRDQLWSPEGSFMKEADQNGRRTVRRVFNPDGLLRESGSLFIKKFPELPGMEAAARNAVLGLFGQGVPYSDLFNINEWPYQVSQGFVHPKPRRRGDLLAVQEREGRDYLKKQIKKLDWESTSSLVISSLLLNPEDAKEDNFVFAPLEGGGLQLISVDNDHILAPTVGDPVIQAENRQPRLTQIYSYLFTMGGGDYDGEGPMDWNIHPQALASFLQSSSDSFLEKYLDNLIGLEEQYGRLFATGPEKVSSRWYFANSYDSCVCVPFNRSMTNLFYDNLCRLRETLKPFQKDGVLTHKDLLERSNPILARGDRLTRHVPTSSSIRAMTQAYGYRSMEEIFEAARGLRSEMTVVRNGIQRLQKSLLETKRTYKERNTPPAGRGSHRLNINGFQEHLLEGHLSQFQIINFLRNLDLGVLEETEADRTTSEIILSALKNPENPLSRIVLQNWRRLQDEDFSIDDHFHKDGPQEGALREGIRVLNLRNLYHLEIPGCYGVTKVLVDRIAREAPSLRRLDISRLNLGGDFSYDRPNFLKLEELVMENLTSLRNLALVLPSLKRLSLNGCVNLANGLFQSINLNCPALAYLGLRDISNFNDRMFDDLISKGNIKDKNNLILKLTRTNVTWPELRELFPKCDTELVIRLRSETSLTRLFEGDEFMLDNGFDTSLGGFWRLRNLGSFLGTFSLAAITPFSIPGFLLNLAFGGAKSWWQARERSKMLDYIGEQDARLEAPLVAEVFAPVVPVAAQRVVQVAARGGVIAADVARQALEREGAARIVAQAGAVAANEGARVAAQAAEEAALQVGAREMAAEAARQNLAIAAGRIRNSEANRLARLAAQKGPEAAAKFASRISRLANFKTAQDALTEAAKSAADARIAQEAAARLAQEAAAKALEETGRFGITEATVKAAEEAAEVAAKKAAQATTLLSTLIGGVANFASSLYDVGSEESQRNKIAKRFLGTILSKGIRENNRLMSVSIPKSNLGDEGVVSLSKALKTNTSLIRLDLSYCGIGDKGAGHLAQSLRENSILTFLDLRNNRISESGAQELMRVFDVNTCLTHLALDGNYTYDPRRWNISNQTKSRISSLLRRNKDLRREYADVIRGARGGQPFAFTLQDSLQEPHLLPGLGIDRLTAVRVLFEEIARNATSRKLVEREIAELVTEPGVPFVPPTAGALKSYIKKVIFKEPGLSLRRSGGTLEALARGMERSFHFWLPDETAGDTVLHQFSLNAKALEALEEIDFLMADGETLFGRTKRLIVLPQAESNLSPTVRPERAIPVVDDGNPKERREPIRYGLSIDGGGMRGLIPALMLSHIERKAREYKPTFKICDVFDYVGGTSVGGILALGLTIGGEDGNPILSCGDLEGLFATHGRYIFGTRFPLGAVPVPAVGRGAIDAQYNPTPLEGILMERFGNRTLTHTLKPVLVTAVDVTGAPARPALFNSCVSSHQFWPVWQVARSTSAAPTYFPFASFNCPTTGRGYNFWDGGVWVNNPSHLVYDNIVQVYDIQNPKHNVRVLSLGTGDTAATYAPPTGHGSFSILKSLLLSQMDLSSETVSQRMQHLLGHGYKRIQPFLTDTSGRPLVAELDDTRLDVLDRYRSGVEAITPELDRIVEEWILPALETTEDSYSLPTKASSKVSVAMPSHKEKGERLRGSRGDMYGSAPQAATAQDLLIEKLKRTTPSSLGVPDADFPCFELDPGIIPPEHPQTLVSGLAVGDGNCFFHSTITEDGEGYDSVTRRANEMRRAAIEAIMGNVRYKEIMKKELLVEELKELSEANIEGISDGKLIAYLDNYLYQSHGLAYYIRFPNQAELPVTFANIIAELNDFQVIVLGISASAAQRKLTFISRLGNDGASRLYYIMLRGNHVVPLLNYPLEGDNRLKSILQAKRNYDAWNRGLV